jgi:hypothetical protein
MNLRTLAQGDIILGSGFEFDGLDLDCEFYGSCDELGLDILPAGLIITATNSDTEESIHWTLLGDGTWEADTDASPLVLEADGTFRLA